MARVKTGEPRRDGLRGNYVSVVSVSASGRGRALIALCIKDYVAAPRGKGGTHLTCGRHLSFMLRGK